MMKKSTLLLAFLSMMTVAQLAEAQRVKKTKTPPPPVDWSVKATQELQKIPVSEGELPTPATVSVHSSVYDSGIEMSALRVGLLVEPYRPQGVGTFSTDESVDYGTLPSSILGQIDLRWLPFDFGQVFGATRAPLQAGGYVAFGYARQVMPLASISGFRYDDVALNSMRFEFGGALGWAPSEKWNLEGRLGVGRHSMIQTSQYAEVVGSFNRSYILTAIDGAYHLTPKFALMGSIANRTGLTGGTGSIGFDPVTVSGGILVQIR